MELIPFEYKMVSGHEVLNVLRVRNEMSFGFVL